MREGRPQKTSMEGEKDELRDEGGMARVGGRRTRWIGRRDGHFHKSHESLDKIKKMEGEGDELWEESGMVGREWKG